VARVGRDGEVHPRRLRASGLGRTVRRGQQGLLGGAQGARDPEQRAHGRAAAAQLQLGQERLREPGGLGDLRQGEPLLVPERADGPAQADVGGPFR
jgi:hypothetical protein